MALWGSWEAAGGHPLVWEHPGVSERRPVTWEGGVTGIYRIYTASCGNWWPQGGFVWVWAAPGSLEQLYTSPYGPGAVPLDPIGPYRALCGAAGGGEAAGAAWGSGPGAAGGSGAA